MRFSLLFALVFFGSSAFGDVDLSGRMPEDLLPELKEVLAVALVHSETMEDRQFIEEQSRGQKMAARSAVLPSFNSTFSFRQERDDERDDGTGFEDRVVYNVTLSQPIYHWGARRAEKQIGDLQYEIQKLATTQTAESLISRVRQDYLALIISKQKLELSRLELEEVRKSLAFHEEQIEAGAESKNSINQYSLALGREELSLLREEADYERRLGNLAMAASMTEAQLESFLSGPIPDFEALSEEDLGDLENSFRSAVLASEEVQRAQLDIEIEKKRLLIEEKALRPKFDAALGVSSNALDVDGTRREQAYSFFGVSVGWRIFDGFRKKGRTLETLNRLVAKERAKSSMESRLLIGFEQALRALEIERKALKIQEFILISDRGRRDWVLENVEAGRLPESEGEKAEREFMRTDITTQAARASYLVALSNLAQELKLESVQRNGESE